MGNASATTEVSALMIWMESFSVDYAKMDFIPTKKKQLALYAHRDVNFVLGLIDVKDAGKGTLDLIVRVVPKATQGEMDSVLSVIVETE